MTYKEISEEYKRQRRRIRAAINRIESRYSVRVDYDIPELTYENGEAIIKSLQAVTPADLRKHMHDLSPWEYTHKEEFKRQQEEIRNKRLYESDIADFTEQVIQNLLEEIDYMPQRLKILIEDQIYKLSEEIGLEETYNRYFRAGGANSIFSRLQKSVLPSEEEIEMFFQELLNIVIPQDDVKEAVDIATEDMETI